MNTPKFYLAFYGQPNTTTGQPNESTGFMSRYGNLYAFSSKEKRSEWLSDNETNVANEVCCAVTKREARSYNLGLSIEEYDRYLDGVYCDVNEG